MERLFKVGKEYTARSGYPLTKERKEAIKHIREGEKLKILEINKEKGELKIVNLSLGSNNAWFWITEDEFKRVLRWSSHHKVLIVEYVSIWDGDEVVTSAKLDTSNGRLMDIKSIDIDTSYNVCEKEFIRLKQEKEVPVVEYEGEYYAIGFLPKVTDIHNSDEEHERLEEVLFATNHNIPSLDLIIFDKGLYVECYGNWDGKYSNTSNGVSKFFYIDVPILYGELIDYNQDIGKIKDDTLTIRIIPARDIDFIEDRKRCQRFSTYFKESKYRRI